MSIKGTPPPFHLSQPLQGVPSCRTHGLGDQVARLKEGSEHVLCEPVESLDEQGGLVHHTVTP